ncbi:MAG: hypothetical protein K6G30_07375 [Acetatifactor sp.]|nr:hypothetical protein [Acetatifactor sp.]
MLQINGSKVQNFNTVTHNLANGTKANTVRHDVDKKEIASSASKERDGKVTVSTVGRSDSELQQMYLRGDISRAE